MCLNMPVRISTGSVNYVLIPLSWRQGCPKLLNTAVLHTSVAGLLARSQYPEGPATGHLGTGFPVSKSECPDGSQASKLLLHASHVALPTSIS